jgi:SAM-dependent methyltransferase
LHSARDLSAIVPATAPPFQDLDTFLGELTEALEQLDVMFEVLLVAHVPDRELTEMAETRGARLVSAAGARYGTVLAAGFAASSGNYLLTLDADLLNLPTTIAEMWSRRGEAEVTIASRYVQGGRATMPLGRRLLSRLLNAVFSRGLSLRIRDMSSGVRLYRADLVRGHEYKASDFDILQEILVRAYMDGWRVQEIPFDYRARRPGSTTRRLFGFGLAYARTLGSLWKTRNSILAADYDDRAHDSPVPLQRYWQRQRFRHVTELIAGEGPVLDVGCGSSRILGALPPGSVGVDILMRKLRYGRKFGTPLVQASGFELPFPDESFSCVLCSQVIEHVPKESPVLDELCRTLAPGGRLVLGTPDYDNWEWVVTEKLYGWFAPGAYADEHIAHYTHDELVRIFTERGFTLEARRYILQGELILAFRKGIGHTAAHKGAALAGPEPTSARAW